MKTLNLCCLFTCFTIGKVELVFSEFILGSSRCYPTISNERRLESLLVT